MVYYGEAIRIPKPSEELAWFLGALAGDGYVSKSRVVLNIATIEFANKFLRVGESLFGIKPKLYTYQPSRKNTQRMYMVQLASTKASNYLGNWYNTGWTKTLVDKFGWVLNNKAYEVAFLTGLFDSDGSVIITKNEYRIHFSAKPIESRLMIVRMLTDLGIKNFNLEHQKRESVVVRNLHDVKKLADLIHSCIPKRESRLEAIRQKKEVICFWTTKEDELLHQQYGKNTMASAALFFPTRTKKAVGIRASRLGLTRIKQHKRRL